MYLITGGNGQLGTELSKRLPDAIRTDVNDLDITHESLVADFVKKYKIDTIINCAAYTAVDKAEDNIDLATKINVDGPANLAKTGAKIVHISTDYVFDGTAHKPYSPDSTKDEINPISIYGKTKFAGEVKVLRYAIHSVIIRTAWLYSPYGNNFVKTMRKLGAEKESINVVADQIGTPTYAADLADAIVKILPQMNLKTRGIYHFTNMGVCSWYDFAHEIMDLSGLKCRVNPIKTTEYPTRAKRPYYSVLDKSDIINTFGLEIPHWKDSLKKCIAEMEKQK
ncbi:MAG: dTDP-4-dehydrorhamnose reductase [Alphaproteobacteria bacterium]|nr:dTDP-4-dehydrorhamnose reductase [Alphaproteobacteria bacterium]